MSNSRAQSCTTKVRTWYGLGTTEVRVRINREKGMIPDSLYYKM